MDQTAEIEFNVDQQYENEKGVFTVLSIREGQMVIRWENGEEIKTEIDLQKRIAERREWEKHNHKNATAAQPSSRSASTGKESKFAGFKPTDFKKTASGTNWRSRNQLGVAVARKIDTNRYKFSSWAFGHKPEMHIQDTKHHDSETADYQAKFFVRVDQKALSFGFQAARPGSADGTSDDWDAIGEWLSQPENEELLHALAVEDNLIVACTAGTLIASAGGWRAENGEGQPNYETLAAYIREAPASEPFVLEISAVIDKSDAQACGRDIAANIAQLFTRLLPLYQAAVIH